MLLEEGDMNDTFKIFGPHNRSGQEIKLLIF